MNNMNYEPSTTTTNATTYQSTMSIFRRCYTALIYIIPPSQSIILTICFFIYLQANQNTTPLSPNNISTMALKLHGTVGSPATFRALVALYEKNLVVDFVPVDLTGENKSPEFLARNPFGQVPALEHGDLTLFESRAICKYVAEAYADKGTSLISKDLKKSAIETVWMEVEAQKFDAATAKLTWELFFKPLFGMTTDDAVVAEFSKKLEPVLDVYEARLTECKYLGGDSYSLADLYHLPNTQILMGTKVKSQFDARPHVSAWASDILSRPAWAKVTSMLPK